MAYHISDIGKGVYGEPSKIQEELDELNDAIRQNNPILIGCELSDIYGALEAVANNYHLTMDDLKKFSEQTKSIKQYAN